MRGGEQAVNCCSWLDVSPPKPFPPLACRPTPSHPVPSQPSLTLFRSSTPTIRFGSIQPSMILLNVSSLHICSDPNLTLSHPILSHPNSFHHIPHHPALPHPAKSAPSAMCAYLHSIPPHPTPQGNLCIIFEYCPQSLYDLLRASPLLLPSSQVIRVARQAATSGHTFRLRKPIPHEPLLAIV